MWKLILPPLLFFIVLLFYACFEKRILDYCLQNSNDGIICSLSVYRLKQLKENDLLFRQLSSPSSRARLFAMRALVEIEDPRIAGEMGKLVADSNDELWQNAVELCAEHGYKAAVPAMLVRLKECHAKKHDGHSASLILKALADLRAKEALPLLRKLKKAKKSGIGLTHQPEILQTMIAIGAPELLGWYRKRLLKSIDSVEGPLLVRNLLELDAGGSIPVFEKAVFSARAGTRNTAADALVACRSISSIYRLQAGLAKVKHRIVKDKVKDTIRRLQALKGRKPAK